MSPRKRFWASWLNQPTGRWYRDSQTCTPLIHRPNLETNTEGFPPPEISTCGEIAALSESSATLELLFQYIYPRRHPSLDDIAFSDLASLAEAAEKYQVFSAMNICRIRMRDVLPQHAAEVLAYAAKHDYPFLVYEAAEFTFDLPLAEVVAMLPAHLVLPWVKYIDAWNAVLHDAISTMQLVHRNASQPHQNTSDGQCRVWKGERPALAQRFGHSLRSLRRLDVIFARDGSQWPDCCEEAQDMWRANIEEAIARIPEFRSFL